MEEHASQECTFRPHINSYTPKHSQMDAETYRAEHRHFGWAECPVEAIGSHHKSFEPQPRSVINLREPEKMARDIRIHQLEKVSVRTAHVLAQPNTHAQTYQ